MDVCGWVVEISEPPRICGSTPEADKVPLYATTRQVETEPEVQRFQHSLAAHRTFVMLQNR